MPRKIRLWSWFVVALVFAAGAGSWALVSESSPKSVKGAARTPTQRARTEGNARPENERMGAAPRAVTVADYGEPAEPESASARKAALAALFAEPNVPKKLSAVLAAVEGEPSAPEQDPLWSQLVSSLADLWHGDTLDHGLDLMVSEQRPRARRALVSSFAFLASSERARELTPAQSQTLSNDFIDLYQRLPPEQQPEVLAALRKVASADVADILAGRTSELERQYTRALGDAKAAPNTERSAPGQ